jgi:hypothetical protein
MLVVTCHDTVYSDISPLGTSIVVLTTLQYGEPWYDVPPEQYVDTKNRIADAKIDMDASLRGCVTPQMWSKCLRR